MPGYDFDLRSLRAKEDIDDALGQRFRSTPQPGPNPMQQLAQHVNVQANPQMQQVGVNMPLGGGLSAGLNAMNMRPQPGQPAMGPQITNVGLNYQRPNGFSAGVAYNPMQRAVGANMRLPFAHGGSVHGYAGGGTVLEGDDGPAIVVEAPRYYDQNRLMDAGGFGGFGDFGRYGSFDNYGGFDLGTLRSGEMTMGGGAGSPTAEQPKAQPEVVMPPPQLPTYALPQPQMPPPTTFLPRGLSVGTVGMPISGPGFDTHGTAPGFRFRAGFQEGGLATSIHSPQDYHERDVEFINTRNQHMRQIAGRPAYAEGGGVWTRKEGQNPEGGLNAKGRASLKAQGHDIKPPVSAKLAAKSPKAAARRKSFCARMSGMEGPMKDEKGRPTRKALALRKWDC